ncbi:outer membrane protein assembly factor BamB family protein [Chryseobacterium caseinilyticum]|uniref:PQQ-binding-like beta-propeller repeat protein n=1 Tax=Chryseobacterium caseinilyticum TaxID=2771428 RepID=A0ABR8ZAJ6_9FLAO|nr:PQQ-binding-like beta-propeller repeat protein [Chryseobacterium caseinilyticum]MBD8082339.1 PQQ-binding-like beta-propeller repeat protein [Chryseobacterium caseinilyticum]
MFNIFKSLKFLPIIFAASVFPQTQIYRSDFDLDKKENTSFKGSLAMSGNTVIFNADNYSLHGINKEKNTVMWERKIGWRSDAAPYIFENSFFYGNYDGNGRKVHQYDISTGETVRELDFQSISTQPYFKNSVMYTTVMADGGKLMAYDLKTNSVLWQKNINFGAEVQPVFSDDRIIANVEDDLWFEIDYDGNFLKYKSEISMYVDEKKVAAKKFHFLSHDQTPITREWLQTNKLGNSEFKIEKNQNCTFLLSENYLTAIGKNGKVKLQINLETIVPPEEYENEALSAIVSSENEKLWFVFQNHLVHYDTKKEKVLRDVYLINWQPHQLILDGRNIWLISRNDGQLYHLDFEPDEELNRKIQREDAIREHYKCDPPNHEKIKAAKEAEKKY